MQSIWHTQKVGASAMIFRVRWWIESYEDTRRMFDRVHTALQGALDGAGMKSPFPTQSVNPQVEPDTVGQLSPGSGKTGDSRIAIGDIAGYQLFPSHVASQDCIPSLILL